MRWPTILACCAFSMNVAFCQTPVREGEMEKLVLIGGDDAAAWRPAEATVEGQTAITKIGASALRFHIDVNHETGEVKYPIGWPRINANLTGDWQRDWSEWDYLWIAIYTDTSRDALPSNPLGMNLYLPAKPNVFSPVFAELKKGEWVDFIYPLSQLPGHNQATEIQFAISESNYQHGDVLDFYIDDICLLRYAEPHISELTVRPNVTYAAERHLLAHFRASGIATDAEATAPAEMAATIIVLSGQDEIVRQERIVTRAANEAIVFLGDDGLAPGTYTVRVTLGEDVSAEQAIRVVESPWAD